VVARFSSPFEFGRRCRSKAARVQHRGRDSADVLASAAVERGRGKCAGWWRLMDGPRSSVSNGLRGDGRDGEGGFESSRSSSATGKAEKGRREEEDDGGARASATGEGRRGRGVKAESRPGAFVSARARAGAAGGRGCGPAHLGRAVGRGERRRCWLLGPGRGGTRATSGEGELGRLAGWVSRPSLVLGPKCPFSIFPLSRCFSIYFSILFTPKVWQIAGMCTGYFRRVTRVILGSTRLTIWLATLAQLFKKNSFAFINYKQNPSKRQIT
jgi:hypothetical protein